MKFRLLLWVLGLMMKRASRSKPAFQTTLENQNLSFQLSSKDGVTRHYIIKDNQVESRSGPINNPTFELSFASASRGFAILTARKPQEAFMRAVQDKDILATGDLSKILWFQSMTRALKR